MKGIRTVFALALGVLSLTAAPIITFNPNTGFTTHANVSQTIGWAFDISSSFTLNQLGWYDQGGDGLGEAHQIGIWDTSQNLLVSASVPAGTIASLDGGYRMISVANTVLAPGQYIIGGQTDPTAGDLLYFNVTEIVNPAVSWFSDRFSNVSSTLTFPVTQGQGATDGFYGPMFGFAAGTSSATPEPASFGLAGLSLLAAILLSQTKKRKRTI